VVRLAKAAVAENRTKRAFILVRATLGTIIDKNEKILFVYFLISRFSLLRIFVRFHLRSDFLKYGKR
jgi:hypothetical protein